MRSFAPITKISAKRLAREFKGRMPFSTVGRPERKPQYEEKKGGRVFRRGGSKQELRQQCFERDRGICQPHLRRGEKVYAAWSRGEMMHRQHGGMGGARHLDTLDNVEWGCRECHRAQHNAGGKPVPAKPKV